MDSYGNLFEKGEPKEKSAVLARYEELAKNGYSGIESVSRNDLDRIQDIHDKYLDFYKEERRMHFGAFALVALAFIILFPALLTATEHFLPLLGVEALLFALLVPYTFVYRRYEEGVRRMMKESVIIENARALLMEKGESDR
jgi:hypothetical protein